MDSLQNITNNNGSMNSVQLAEVSPRPGTNFISPPLSLSQSCDDLSVNPINSPLRAITPDPGIVSPLQRGRSRTSEAEILKISSELNNLFNQSQTAAVVTTKAKRSLGFGFKNLGRPIKSPSSTSNPTSEPESRDSFSREKSRNSSTAATPGATNLTPQDGSPPSSPPSSPKTSEPKLNDKTLNEALTEKLKKLT